MRVIVTDLNASAKTCHIQVVEGENGNVAVIAEVEHSWTGNPSATSWRNGILAAADSAVNAALPDPAAYEAFLMNVFARASFTLHQ